jgi:hypothetical protein
MIVIYVLFLIQNHLNSIRFFVIIKKMSVQINNLAKTSKIIYSYLEFIKYLGVRNQSEIVKLVVNN